MFHNKKGMGFFISIAIALVVFILLVVFYNNVFGAGKVKIERQFTCKAALGIGYGECTDTCESPNQKIPSKECKEGQICCISLEKPDELMPQNYGGNKELDFQVLYIGPKELPSGCKKGQKDYEIMCTPDKAVTLLIKVGVENTGKKALNIGAYPTIADQSGALSPKALEGTPINVKPKEKKEVYVGYEFKGPGTKTGVSYRIYSAAQCISADCKKTDSKGIYRKLEGSYMNVVFVKS